MPGGTGLGASRTQGRVTTSPWSGEAENAHWLRHFFASAGLSKGVPVTDMAEWLGHRDPKITHHTYAHVMPDAPERLRSLMDAVFTTRAELNSPLEFEAVAEAA